MALTEEGIVEEPLVARTWASSTQSYLHDGPHAARVREGSPHVAPPADPAGGDGVGSRGLPDMIGYALGTGFSGSSARPGLLAFYARLAQQEWQKYTAPPTRSPAELRGVTTLPSP